MRNTDLQMQEILSRAEKLHTGRKLKKRLWLGGGCCALCLLLLIFVAACLPMISEQTEGLASGAFGSLVLGTPALGYVLVGVLSFALGVGTLWFCLNLRRWRGLGK